MKAEKGKAARRSKSDELRFDKRLLGRRDGVSPQEMKRHLASLPDLADQAETVPMPGCEEPEPEEASGQEAAFPGLPGEEALPLEPASGEGAAPLDPIASEGATLPGLSGEATAPEGLPGEEALSPAPTTGEEAEGTDGPQGVGPGPNPNPNPDPAQP